MKRFIAVLLTVLLVFDSNMVVLAEEVQDVVTENYEEYRKEQDRKEQLEKAEEQVVPQRTEDVSGGTKVGEDNYTDEADATQEVSLRLPDTQDYVDENEARLTGLYGEPIEVKEHEKTYQVDATHYVTLLTSRANTYRTEDGEEKEVDLSLIGTDSEGDTVYSPKDSGLFIELPKETTEDTGIKIGSGEHTLELFPEEETYGNATVQDNALLYNHVRENVDVQYTVDTGGLKEDIILQKRQEDTVFRYTFDGAQYDAKEEDNQILIREKDGDEVLFVLAAPVMSDAAGEESQAITLSLEKKEDKYTVVLEADREWLDSPDRVYPVKIDPTVTVPTENLVEVTTSTVHGTYHGTGYGYAGYITAAMTKVPGARDIGKSRMYFAIHYDFADNIPKEARIDSATLNVYEYVKYPETNATFACYRIKSPWNAGSLTWDSSVGLSLEPSGANSISGAKVGMHTFDIRESVNSWMQGLAPNYGLVVMATNESNYGGAFYTPYSTGTAGQTDFTWDKRPSITINWSVPDPVDINYGINNTSVALRTMIQTERSGKLQFQGVFADGIAAPGSMVAYTLNDTAKNYAGLSYASYSYKYPDSSAFDSAFPEGTTKYKDKLGNWQTAVPFTDTEFNVLYHIQAAATKKGTTGKTNKSEDFTVYKVTRFDTLPKIAAYYGVPLSQIMYDNRVQDMLLVENNTLFIRNPQKNATVPYNPPALTNDEKAAIDSALMGRGLHCEFGFEPVNLNTGNFYLERTDVSIPDYTSDFAITRSYNSKGAGLNSAFGRGWAFGYSEQLSQDEEGNLYYTREDGSILLFTKDGEAYTAPAGYDLTLKREETEKKTYDFGDGEEEYPVYEYTITDSTQTVRTFNYFGMLTSVEDEKGNRTVLSYDADQKLVQIKSPAGSKYGITTDKEGHITEIALPNGSQLSYGYDDNGNLVSYTDACGAVTRYEYDENHRMTAWYDGNGTRIVQNAYDEEGRVTEQTDANGGVSILVYEEGKTTATDAKGHVTVYYYDDMYRTTKVENPDGTTRTMKYNADNRLVSETDELGHTTKHKYDSAGNEIQEIRFDGKVRSWEYDSDNHVVAEISYSGVRTEYSYDKRGNVEEIRIDGKKQVSLDTDAKGRITAVTDAEGNRTSLSYSGANLTGITDAKGSQTVLSYNAHGQVTKVTDAMGGVSTTTYDREGRTTGETTAGGVYTAYTFDGAGNVIQVTDGNGNSISVTYDGLGNELTVDNGSGGVYSYVYDEVGNLIQATDAENRRKTYTYDIRGNLITERDAAGAVKNYTYDALGNLLTETDAKGAVTTYTYDYASGKAASVTDNEGNTTTYSYTEDGLLHAVDYPGGYKRDVYLRYPAKSNKLYRRRRTYDNLQL